MSPVVVDERREETTVNPRSRAARGAVLLANGLSRTLGLGSGSTIGGRIGLTLDPTLLETLAAGRTLAVVSGTNGKTTTTRLLSEALGGGASVATSSAGANMPAGIVAALAAAPAGVLGALEVDEGYLGEVVRAVRPQVVLALNLSRDQLDRVGEVRKVAARWQEAFAATGATVVANCDDPLVVWAAGAARHVVWVAAGGAWCSDAYHCPACDARIEFAAPGTPPGWSCACGLQRPEPQARLDGDVLVLGGRSLPISLALPGRFNRANAAMAATAASVLGRDPGAALEAMARVEEVAGRFALLGDGEVAVRLMLAKNPAGWAELIELLADGDQPVVVAINARDADGHDPSWLWDVPFERLARRSVVATGERRHDLAVRLRHAGVGHTVVEGQLAAVRSAGSTALDYVGNYTAFQELRRALASGARTAPRPAHAGTAPGPAPADAPAPAPPAAAGRRSRPARSRRTPLAVVVVHPDLLGTYGDVGNGVVLANRAAWRGMPVELVLAPSDQPLPRTADIYCLGGGEDGPQARSAMRLGDGTLARAVEHGATVLAVCAGFQIVGVTFPGTGGGLLAGLGLIDVATVRGTGPRSVGEVVVEPDAHHLGLRSDYRLSGFENHAGATRLGPGVAALGRVRAGTGNGAGDRGRSGGLEGAIAGRVVATYLHGPVLARNPALADRLLELATGEVLMPLDDEEEETLRAERLQARPGRLRPAARTAGRVG